MYCEEHEVAVLLQMINIPKYISKTLAYLLCNDKLTSSEIETKLKMNPSQSSLALKYLINNNWVDLEILKDERKKGRPAKVYTLSVSSDIIFDIIKNKLEIENKIRMNNIEKLKLYSSSSSEAVSVY